MLKDPDEIRLQIAGEYASEVRNALEGYRSAYVFGSTAKFKARPESDVDMMIVLDIRNKPTDPMHSYTEDLHRIAAKLQNKYGIKVSPYWVREDFKGKSPLAITAIREGHLIDSI